MSTPPTLREAASELLLACIADFGIDEIEPDDNAVAFGTRGDSAVTFGHLRRLQQALQVPEPDLLDPISDHLRAQFKRWGLDIGGPSRVQLAVDLIDVIQGRGSWADGK